MPKGTWLKADNRGSGANTVQDNKIYSLRDVVNGRHPSSCLFAPRRHPLSHPPSPPVSAIPSRTNGISPYKRQKRERVYRISDILMDMLYYKCQGILL